MNNRFSSQILKHIFIYFVEIVIVSGIISLFFEYLQPSTNLYEYLEKFFVAYGAYQLFIYIIFSNIDDIQKDKTLMLVGVLKKCILYKDYRDKRIKEDIIREIDSQLSNNVMNDELTKRLLKNIQINLDTIDIVSLELELLAREHDLEYYQLQWRLSIILRKIK